LVHARAEEIPFTIGGPPGADDPDDALVGLGVPDDHEPAIDRSDGDEAIFELRMIGSKISR